MPGFGPPPAENKRRRNKDEFEDSAVSVSASPVTGAPDLPDAGMYCPQTRAWYETWRQAPQAAVFTVTDWQRLHMLAPLIEAFWQEPSTKLLAEIRLNESLLGATHVDRMRARIKIEQPMQEPANGPGQVTDMTAARRKRMIDAS